jgi:hypothetical protein
MSFNNKDIKAIQKKLEKNGKIIRLYDDDNNYTCYRIAKGKKIFFTFKRK